MVRAGEHERTIHPDTECRTASATIGPLLRSSTASLTRCWPAREAWERRPGSVDPRVSDGGDSRSRGASFKKSKEA